MNTIKMTETELRALAWEEDSNPMAYRVARADVYGCEEADGGQLEVLPYDWDNTYYGASAKLPDGRTLCVAVGEAGDDLQITVDGQDAEIDIGDDPTIDWADVTGCPIADTDADDRRRKAVRKWVRELYAHNGIILHYRDTLYIGQARCNDGWREDHDYADELDCDEAEDALAEALLGDGDGVDISGLDGRSWCGQIGDDLTRDEAIDAAKAQLECDPDATSAPVDYVPITCYSVSDYGWTWWHAGDAVRDCVITRDDLDDAEGAANV